MIFKNPSWINSGSLIKSSLDQWSDQELDAIASRLKKIQSNQPTVSIVIPAYNEEINIIKCLDSFSRIRSKFPFEIIVVDNNSKDKTAQNIKRLSVTYLFQKIQGCGVARQLGMENARGKYILTADGDTMYPPCWIDELMKKLEKPRVVCVCGRYSFLGDAKMPRWKLMIYETLVDIFVLIKSIKRPHLNAFGSSMGYVKDVALKVGYVDNNIAGEDGRLAFDLAKFGKIKLVMSYKSRVMTSSRTIVAEGSLTTVFRNRMVRVIANLSSLFTKHEDHDTRTSQNSSADYNENIKIIKKKIGLSK